MKKWSEGDLIAAGYEIKNAKITNANLVMEDHGVLSLDLILEGSGWGVVFGGYVLGHGYVGADVFKGSASGTEYIMRIMDILNTSNFINMVGKYVRVASLGWGENVNIIGNIVDDKWFDALSFYNDYKG